MIRRLTAGTPTHAYYLLSHWLMSRLDHTKHCSRKPLVPASAHHYTVTWKCLLSQYQFFLEGFLTGFWIGVVGYDSNFKVTKKNLQMALKHPQVVQEYLSAEIQEHRLSGPFPKTLIPSAHISPFGVIPMSHQSGKWHLFVKLSHPNGNSVNDAIPQELCSIS